MKNLRYSGIALLLGVWYLNDGKDKGPFTLTVEISLIVIGAIGMALDTFLTLRKKRSTDRKLDRRGDPV